MQDQYNQRLLKIEAVLEKWLPREPDSSWLKMVFGQEAVSAAGGEPRPSASAEGSGGALIGTELAASLIRPGRDLLDRGGKRWRPLLMLLIAECIAGEEGAAAALPLTPLVEFPHNASLIHDDIEDNSDERRGKPAVHLIYGTDAAINGGAFMYFLPLVCLSSYTIGSETVSGEIKDLIWTTWASHMKALHLGQAMDIAWHRDFHSLPTLDEYDRMCRLKTGCLARLAAVLGVFCTGLNPATLGDALLCDDGQSTAALKGLAHVFGKAAEQLGVGFQILDDVKNLDAGVPGKKRGDDIVEGKKSLPVLLYLHRYPEKRDFAARCFAAARAGGTGAPEAEELIADLERAGVLAEAREKALEYIDSSGRVFSAAEAADFLLKQEIRELLSGLINVLGAPH